MISASVVRPSVMMSALVVASVVQLLVVMSVLVVASKRSLTYSRIWSGVRLREAATIIIIIRLNLAIVQAGEGKDEADIRMVRLAMGRMRLISGW